MTKSRLLVDYEIVEMSGTKLAIFKNGGEDDYVISKNLFSKDAIKSSFFSSKSCFCQKSVKKKHP